MAFLLVSVGTDGATSWVRTPDGRRHNLGTLSVLSFVTKLSKSSRVARQTLNRYLKEGEAMFSVDAEKMWALMQPQRARWASDPLMTPDQQTPTHSTRPRTTMSTISENLTRTEKVIAYLNKKASEGETDPKAFDYLQREASRIEEPSLEYLSLPKAAAPKQASLDDDLTFTTYESNMKLAKRVLQASKETIAAIDQKVAEGRQFNASRAKADVHAVTSRVASICSETQLTEDWVQADLQKLAAKANQIHALFHPKKS